MKMQLFHKILHM